MIKYRLYNNDVFLYEGCCDSKKFDSLKERYNFGHYEIVIMS